MLGAKPMILAGFEASKLLGAGIHAKQRLIEAKRRTAIARIVFMLFMMIIMLYCVHLAMAKKVRMQNQKRWPADVVGWNHRIRLYVRFSTSFRSSMMIGC